MRVPVFWLRELVSGLPAEAGRLADGFTMAGLPVDAVETFGGGVKGVVAGRLEDVAPLAGSDHLKVCKVEVGRPAPVTIVTGAPNVATGQTVPVALPGAVLADGREMGWAEFRGVRSEGMLCSANELGLSDMEGDGIMLLPEPLPPGEDLTAALHLGEAVLVFELTANRADCLSLLGLAREAAAIFGGEFRPPEIRAPETGAPVETLAAVVVLDPDGCPRYVARVLEDAQVGASPLWMQQRLRACGLRPISNLVDVTNYVMLELGQPLHAFDLDRVADHRIIVRRAGSGEELVTLDGSTRSLTLTDLVIADARGPVAVAGVMGGQGSEVTPTTRRVLLESAYFNPTMVRRTAKRLGMRSEASSRFEKGIDPDGQALAADRAAQLMAEIAGAVVAAGRVDANPVPVTPRTITLRPARVNALLGTSLAAEEVVGYLRRLPGLSVVAEGAAYAVTVPTWRRDLEQEADLVEEVARLHGYDRIPATLPAGQSVDPPETPARRQEQRLRELFLAAGLSEATTSSLVARDYLDAWQVPAGSPLRRSVELVVPLSEAQAVLRTTLLPSLGEALKRNLNRRQTEVRLFELGRVFWPTVEGELPQEPRHAAGLLTGTVGAGWWGGERKVDFFDAKGIVELALDGLGIRGASFRPAERAGFHPGRCAEVLVDGRAVGLVAELHPAVQAALDAPERVAVFELNLELLLAAGTEAVAFRALPRFPAIRRDLAVILPAGIPAEAVRASIAECAGPLLESVQVFDVYSGANLPAGRRSLAFALSFRSAERTLTDAEVEGVVATVVGRLAEAFGAELRR